MRFLLIVLIFLSRNLQATTIIELSEEELAKQADVIVQATIDKPCRAVELKRGPSTMCFLNVIEVISGDVKVGDELSVCELGGRSGSRELHIFGSVEYRQGEQVLAFLNQQKNSCFQTVQMTLGKHLVELDEDGEILATRDDDNSEVLAIRSNQLVKAENRSQRLREVKAKVRAATRNKPNKKLQKQNVTGGEFAPLITIPGEDFVLMGAIRWFEADFGQTLQYYIHGTGDSKLGYSQTEAAARAAADSWTNIPTSSISINIAGSNNIVKNWCPSPATAVSGLTFNDPFDEVPPPSSGACGGVLAIGGYCASGQSGFRDRVYADIYIGKVIFSNNLYNCSYWTQTNVSEIAAHEIGHSLGFGHSTDRHATMYSMAHFDGRGAGLTATDIAGAEYLYPGEGTPEPQASAPPPPPQGSLTIDNLQIKLNPNTAHRDVVKLKARITNSSAQSIASFLGKNISIQINGVVTVNGILSKNGRGEMVWRTFSQLIKISKRASGDVTFQLNMRGQDLPITALTQTSVTISVDGWTGQ